MCIMKQSRQHRTDMSCRHFFFDRIRFFKRENLAAIFENFGTFKNRYSKRGRVLHA